jgi:ribonuclease PH
VLTSKEEFVEVQGTAEGRPFTKTQMDQMTASAIGGCRQLFAKQAEIIGKYYPL